MNRDAAQVIKLLAGIAVTGWVGLTVVKFLQKTKATIAAGTAKL